MRLKQILHDGRWLIAAFLIVYFTCVLVTPAGSTARRSRWWSLGVPADPFSFLDVRGVLSALECARAGFDPLRLNPCDVRERVLPYPRIWLLLRYTGVTQNQTVPVGLGLGAAFLVSVLSFLGRLTWKEGLLVSIFLTSPAVMFLLERGNSDIPVIVIAMLSLVLIKARAPGGYLALLLAAMLKLYPIAGVAVALREKPGRALAVIGTLIAAFFAYVALSWNDIHTIVANNYKTDWRSYGRMVIFRWLRRSDLLPAELLSDRKIFVLSWSLFALAVAAGWWCARRTDLQSADKIDAFRYGAAIYIATFAFGDNFDYKLAFLILMVPQLLSWVRGSDSRLSAASSTLALLLMTVWSGFLQTHRITGLAVPLEELLSWLLLIGCVSLFLASLPNWLRSKVWLPAAVAVSQGRWRSLAS